MIRFRLFLLFALCLPSLADSGLDALHATLIGMRGKSPDSGGPRGATPALTVVKHQLRDWVESRLKGVTLRGDEGELGSRLNAELREAKLFCDDTATGQPPCPDQDRVGFLDGLTFRRSRGFLILQTAVGIECGFDESAYLYSWTDEGWRRIWQTEQNTYTEKEYKPQSIEAVMISPYNRANDYVLLTLGLQSWCSSGWHDVYYRAFRLGPDPSAAPLVEGDEGAYIAVDPPIQGSVTRDDILVEFTIRSIDAGVHSRKAVRHYRIDGDQVRRTDPLALSPRDFLDEWLTHDWRDAAFWSESPGRGNALDWHKKLHKDFVAGEFIYPTTHCADAPDVWQVGVDFSDPPTPPDAEPKGTYFLVRRRPPYQFTMVGVSDRASPACMEEDRRIDDEFHTLFPIQDK